MTAVRVFVPASIGNVGPGFDVLGVAVEGLGDVITLALSGSTSASIGTVSGRDAALIPRDPKKNCAAIAATSFLKRLGASHSAVLGFERRLPLAGGLGSSAAASVAGAFAAAVATGCVDGTDASGARPEILQWIFEAALDGESAVAGRHLDNIAPMLLGGLCLALGVAPPRAVRLPVQGDWWLTVVSPALRVETKAARAVLPDSVDRGLFVKQMACTTGLVTAFATGDAALLRDSLHDHFAEPRRAPLIAGFAAVKAAALAAGALGASISGAGPTIFAVSSAQAVATAVAAAMVGAFTPVASEAHVGRIDSRGVRVV